MDKSANVFTIDGGEEGLVQFIIRPTGDRVSLVFKFFDLGNPLVSVFIVFDHVEKEFSSLFNFVRQLFK
jgi:hypothetical protein